MTLDVQALTILNMIGAGICLGAAFDTYTRLFWRKKRNWFSNFQDILFWIASSLLIFMWLRLVNLGEMRIVIFLSLLCGYAAYRALFQRSYKSILEKIIYIIITIYRLIKRFLYLFIYTPLYWIFSSLVALILFIVNLLVRFFILISYPLRKIKGGFPSFMAKWFKKKEK